MRFISRLSFYVVVFIGIVSQISSCSSSDSNSKNGQDGVPLASIIENYTQGLLVKQSELKVKFLFDVPESIRTQNKSLFKLSPELKGTQFWLDERTVVFKPEQGFESGKKYRVDVLVNNVLLEGKKAEKTFSFDVQIIGLFVDVSVENLQIHQNGTDFTLKGILRSSDVLEEINFAEVLQTKLNGEKIDVRFERKSPYSIEFFVDLIKRSQTNQTLVIEWNTKKLGFESEGSKEISIPGINEFAITKVEYVKEQNPHFRITFSDELKPNQALKGLITVNNSDYLRFEINKNSVSVFPIQKITNASASIVIRKSIKNASNIELNADEQHSVVLNKENPAVQFLSEGAILPKSGKLYVPFKAISLKKVDVRVYKIFTKNIPQFLQVNTLNTYSEINRVGKFIKGKRVNLVELGAISGSDWNTYVLNVEDLIKAEPGAIYRFQLSFRKEYAITDCETSSENIEENDALDLNLSSFEDMEQSNWDSYEEYYYPEGYSWKERNNPCHVSYYTSDKNVSKNVYASDIGLIVKSNTNKKIEVAVTNLITTKSIQDAEVQLLNFQLQQIASAKTDANGFASLTFSDKPWLVRAKVQDQEGYVILNQYSALPLSSFNVAGASVKQGIKAFLYTERGVWRPGDSLFVGLIVENNENQLPKNHPVLFELINSRQQTIQKTTLTESLNGVFVFRTKTQTDAPTGIYTVQAKVGGQVFTKKLKIETVKPNRLKIAMTFKDDFISVSSPFLKANLQSNWLHGAPASNLEFTIMANYKNAPFKLEKYPTFSFFDETLLSQTNSATLVSGDLDENGSFEINKKIEGLNQSPSRVQIDLSAIVYEKSGDFSTMAFSTFYHPFSQYIGVDVPKGDKRDILLTDKKHAISMIVVDQKGNPIPNTDVSYSVFKLEWRWWFEQNEENLSSYFERKRLSPISTGSAKTDTNGKAEGFLEIKYPEWGRYLIKAKDEVSGHTATKVVYVDWPGWAGRSRDGGNKGANIIPVRMESETYKVGDLASVLVPAAVGSRVLFSIEKSDKVLFQQWVDGKGDETKFSFKVDEKMTPNIFVHVHSISPFDNQTNDLPIRQYGVQKVAVFNPNAVLFPQLETSSHFEPNAVETLKISEKNGREMTYTIALVDEGLLDLTRFKTPNPYDYFFAEEALTVQTWDLYDYVASRYLSNSTRIISLGGDGDVLIQKDGLKMNRFESVVKVLGPFSLGKKEIKSHKITIPNYVGSVRAMIIASDKGSYGTSEKAIPVKKPLMVLATAPRVIGTNEQFKLPVTLFSMDENIKEVLVEVKVEGAIYLKSDAKKNVVFTKLGDQLVTFDLATNDAFGAGNIYVKASSGSHKSEYSIQLPVRNYFIDAIEIKDTLLLAGKSAQFSTLPLGIKGSNSFDLSLSTFNALAFEHRLDDLMNYPHGCLEQITSKSFPQLALNKLKPLADSSANQIQKNIKAAIQQIASFLKPDGSLAYWPEGNRFDAWSMAYAVHFLTEAEKNGYVIPVALSESVEKNLKSRVTRWERAFGDYNDVTQAYMLYVLAKRNKAEIGAMNRLRELEKTSSLTKWILAASYYQIGQKEVANDLLLKHNYSIKTEPDKDSYFSTDVRDKAMLLWMMSEMKITDDAADLAIYLAQNLSRSNYLTTQEMAFSLNALAAFAGDISTGNGIKAKLTNGEKVTNYSSDSFVFTSMLDAKKMSSSITIKNEGDKNLFVTLIKRGKTEAINSKAQNKNLQMKIIYRDLENKVLDVSQLKQGTSFFAEISVQNNSLNNLEFIALTQPIVAGWEILNTKVDATFLNTPSSTYDFQDIKDDKILTYFGLKKQELKVFRVLLAASYAGNYTLPVISVSDMYNEKNYAFSASGKASVN